MAARLSFSLFCRCDFAIAVPSKERFLVFIGEDLIHIADLAPGHVTLTF